MPLYPTCSHIKENGVFCGVAAVRNQKYCYHHLAQRARSLRRARALRDNAPYRLEIQPLDNPYAVRIAVTEIVQALGSGQLDPLVAGKMLYGIQLVRAENKRIAQMESAAANDEAQAPAGDAPRVLELPDFEQKLGLAPGADLDAVTEVTFQQADEAVADRQPLAMPAPPPAVRVGSAAWRIYREECYQGLQLEVKDLRFKLREYFEQKRQETQKEVEAFYKDAGIPYPTAAKKSPASTATENNPEDTRTA